MSLPQHLGEACREGNLAVVKGFVSQNVGCLRDTDPNGRIPLHDACQSGNLELVSFLVGKYPGALRKTDFDGSVPLHEACAHGHANIVRYLLGMTNKTAEVKNAFGRLALHEACSNGDTETVRAILEVYKYGLRIRDNDGLFPLHHACRAGATDTVRLLLKGFKRGSFHIKDNHHMFPIHHACISGKMELVEYLWTQYPDSFVKKDILDRYPSDVAREHNHTHLVPFLLEMEKEQERLSSPTSVSLVYTMQTIDMDGTISDGVRDKDVESGLPQKRTVTTSNGKNSIPTSKFNNDINNGKSKSPYEVIAHPVKFENIQTAQVLRPSVVSIGKYKRQLFAYGVLVMVVSYYLVKYVMMSSEHKWKSDLY